MKLKLDENLSHDLAAQLGDLGHDVHTVIDEQLGGHSDPVVVTAATDEGRMLLTLDRGVGDLRRYPPGSHAGIVVLRPVAQDPDAVRDLVARLVQAHPVAELRGCVVLVRASRLEVITLSQPEDLFNVSVHVRCGCGAVREFCVPTDQRIPGPLRCTLGPPGGRSGDGAIRCPAGHDCGIGLSELRARALKELEHGRGEHVRTGAVVIECQ